MKTKFKSFSQWLVVVGIFLAVIGSCGGLSYLIWNALGTTLQQIVIGVFAIGVVWNCILPIALFVFGLLVLFGIFLLLVKLGWIS